MFLLPTTGFVCLYVAVESAQTEEASDGGSKPKEGGVAEEVKTVAEATADTGKVQVADSDVSVSLGAFPREREKYSLTLHACGYVFLQAEEFASDQPYNSESVAKETVQTELDQLGVSLEKTGMAWYHNWQHCW